MNADTVAALEKRVTRVVTDAMVAWGAPELSSVVLALASAPEAADVALEVVALQMTPAKMQELGLSPEDIRLVVEWRETRVNVLPFRVRVE